MSQELFCILCTTEDENKTTGPLLFKDDTAAHENCLLYSSGIYCKNSPAFDDLGGFDVEDVRTEYNRGQKLKCYRCKKKGATVGCENTKCKRSYHYPCAIEDNAKRVKNKFKGQFMLYCPNHNPDRHKHSHLANDSHCSAAGSNSSAKKKLNLDNSHGETSSESDSVGTHLKLRRKKRKHDVTLISDSDEEEIVPRQKHMQSTPIPENERNRNREEPTPSPPEVYLQGADGDETDIEEIQTTIEPAITEQTTIEPAITEQTTIEPAITEQTTIEPAITEQTTIEPVITEQTTIEPAITEQITIEPAITEQTTIELTPTESESLLESEYRSESVPFNIISDSEPFSIDSENSIGTTSPSLLSSSAAAPIDNPNGSLSAPEQAACVHTPTVTTPVINPLEPDCPLIDSTPLGGASAAEPVESPNQASPTVPLCGDSDYDNQPAHPASQNIALLNISHGLPESHTPPEVRPPNLFTSQRCSTACLQATEGIEEARAPKTGAALFWRRCNEVGCTESIFSELTKQISSLAVRVQSQHATEQEYAVSLRILEASGKLPAIFQQLDQDFEKHERELKRKREALKEARALLNHPS